MSNEDSEEFKKFKIVVNLSAATCLFEPNSLSQFQKAFPKARPYSEWIRDHPVAFARSRYTSFRGFMTPLIGLRIQDGEFSINIFENGRVTIFGPRRVANVLNMIADYAKALKDHGLYSKDLFIARFTDIQGTAKMPVGLFGGINLYKAVKYLADASYNPAENQALVYNMNAMDVQIFLKANGEIVFATNVEESNIARALRLLQQSLKEERDVSIDTVKEQEQQQGKQKYVFCVGCGAKLPVDATFCKSCGNEQPKL
jgi:TATA-box binding protein (TBP) (component of TFIID and TFIIIB)/ribosomal protein L40E